MDNATQILLHMCCLFYVMYNNVPSLQEIKIACRLIWNKCDIISIQVKSLCGTDLPTQQLTRHYDEGSNGRDCSVSADYCELVPCSPFWRCSSSVIIVTSDSTALPTSPATCSRSVMLLALVSPAAVQPQHTLVTNLMADVQCCHIQPLCRTFLSVCASANLQCHGRRHDVLDLSVRPLPNSWKEPNRFCCKLD